ncbi:MAG: ATP-binding protein [Nocardioidaceae bacterium]|nr:ATP-binding protein [Nocardioidaceae bacterium]
MNRVAPDAPRSPTVVDRWAAQAFARLGVLPGVTRVGLALVEGGGRRLRFTASDRQSGAGMGWCHIDAYDDVPLNTAIRSGVPLLGSVADLPDRYAAFAEAQRGTGHVAVAAVPIGAAGAVLGGFVAYFDQPQSFEPTQSAMLLDHGDRLGAGLRRALLHLARRPVGPARRPETAPGELSVTREFPAELTAVADARHLLTATLLDWGLRADQVETAVLCLSELVTNAVIHAHGGCAVRVALLDRLLTVRVSDSGVAGALPLEPSGDPLRVHGRGLLLVEALATRWGHEAGADGVSVWYALELDD